MRFEWDEAKNRRNLAKHKIGFETAKLVFEDSHALSFQDLIVDGEERWQTFGMIGGLVVMGPHLLGGRWRRSDPLDFSPKSQFAGKENL